MSSPASFFDQIVHRVGEALQPPGWVVEEMQRRLVVMLNHVLQQEPEAQARLKRQSGRVVEAHWRNFNVRLQSTPAGLLDLAPLTQLPDLQLTLTEESPFTLAQSALRGEKPAVRIAGDVQLAAEVQWLVDHVRWDLEEDLSRIVGDAPAHTIGQMVRRLADGVRQFVARGPSTPPSTTSPSTTSPAATPSPAAPSAPGQAGG